MGWWTEYASRNSSICGQNFLLEIAVFKDGESNKLNLKYSFCKLYTNCVISYYFYVYFIFYTYAARFNVTKNLKFFANFFY